MTDNFIQLGKSDVLRLEIRTEDGKSTGEFLEFNLEDIELPLKIQEMQEKNKKNKEWIRNQLLIISKRQDVKGKKLLSKNQEDEIKALNEFFNREVEVYNMILGENGVQKLLNGRKIGWTSLQEIDEIIEKQIQPHLKVNMDNIKNKIKEKYSIANIQNNQQIEVIE